MFLVFLYLKKIVGFYKTGNKHEVLKILWSGADVFCLIFCCSFCWYKAVLKKCKTRSVEVLYDQSPSEYVITERYQNALTEILPSTAIICNIKVSGEPTLANISLEFSGTWRESIRYKDESNLFQQWSKHS